MEEYKQNEKIIKLTKHWLENKQLIRELKEKLKTKNEEEEIREREKEQRRRQEEWKKDIAMTEKCKRERMKEKKRIKKGVEEN